MKVFKVASILILILLIAPLLQFVPVGSAASGSSTSSWWNPSYGFRSEVSFTNPTNELFVNHPVLLRITFGPSQVFDAVPDLALVNASASSQTEVPSFVLNQQYSGSTVSSATLLFFATMKPSSTSTLDLYYGNPTARIHSPRLGQPTTGFSNGLISFQDTTPSPGSDLFSLTYGSTFAESFSSKVFLGPQQGYGSSGISASPYGNATGWTLVGNDTSTSTLIAAEAMTAGEVRLTRAFVVYPDNALILNIEEFGGSGVPSGSRYIEVVNSSILSALGQTISSYDGKTGAYSSSVAGAVVRFVPATIPSHYDVGNSSTIIADASSGSFESRSLGNDANGAFSWELGAAQQGGMQVLTWGWSVARSSDQLHVSTGNIQPLIAQTGAEEARGSFVPAASLQWRASVPLIGVSVGPRGLAIPLDIRGANWLPGTLGLGGTVSYALPGPGFAKSSQGWTTGSGSTGNLNAASSTTFFSLDKGASVGRLSLFSYASNSTGYAHLTSNTFTISGSTNPRLVINYQASLDAIQGLPSDQTIFAAVDIGNGMTGTITDTLLFPVAGTSTAFDPFSCGRLKLATPFPTGSTSVINVGSLIADGSWRSLDLSLGTWTQGSLFQARIRFCVESSSTFVGSSQMLVSSAKVTGQAKAQDILIGSLSYQAPVLTLGLKPAGAFLLSPVNMTGNLTFLITSPFNSLSLNGSSFRGDAPSPKALINTTRGPPTVGFSITPTGLMVQSPFVQLEKVVSIENRTVPASQGAGVIYSGSLGLSPQFGNATFTYSYSIKFQAYPLVFSVVDADGNPVPGAKLEFFFQPFSPPVFTGSTNSSGIASASLLPWNYDVLASYDGYEVVSQSEAVNGSGRVQLNSNVYEMRVQVTDSIHKAIPGAQVSLSAGNATKSGLTDPNGVFAFQAAPDQVYQVVVSVGSTQIYSSSLKATPNNSMVEIIAPTQQSNTTLEVIEVLVVVAVIVLSITYLTFWRKRPR